LLGVCGRHVGIPRGLFNFAHNETAREARGSTRSSRPRRLNSRGRPKKSARS
jgi:hypothetical protein